MAVLRLALLHSFNPKSDVWWPPSEIRILKVHGRGIRMLLDAGIPAELGVREAEAREVNIAF